VSSNFTSFQSAPIAFRPTFIFLAVFVRLLTSSGPVFRLFKISWMELDVSPPFSPQVYVPFPFPNASSQGSPAGSNFSPSVLFLNLLSRGGMVSTPSPLAFARFFFLIVTFLSCVGVDLDCRYPAALPPHQEKVPPVVQLDLIVHSKRSKPRRRAASFLSSSLFFEISASEHLIARDIVSASSPPHLRWFGRRRFPPA